MKRRIGDTDLEVFPLALGGNTFGWTSSEAESFGMGAGQPGRRVGGDPGPLAEGEEEPRPGRHRHQGRAARGVRGARAQDHPRRRGSVAEAPQVDTVDLYYAHIDDRATPLAESLGAFDALVREGKVRYLAASQYTAPRLEEALAISKQNGLARYVALQTHYSLVHREGYEGALAAVCARENVSCIPFWALAKGFLTGKYRAGRQVESARQEGASAFLDARGLRVLNALDAVGAARGAPVAAVSLAWLLAQEAVAVPLASARVAAQLEDLLPTATLELTAEDLRQLTEASASAA